MKNFLLISLLFVILLSLSMSFGYSIGKTTASGISADEATLMMNKVELLEASVYSLNNNIDTIVGDQSIKKLSGKKAIIIVAPGGNLTYYPEMLTISGSVWMRPPLED